VAINSDGTYAEPPGKFWGIFLIRKLAKLSRYVTSEEILSFSIRDGQSRLGGLDIFATKISQHTSASVFKRGKTRECVIGIDFTFIMTRKRRMDTFASNRGEMEWER